MIPCRLSPFAPPVPTSSASDARPSSDEITADNTVPNSALAQTPSIQAGQLSRAGTASGIAPPSARKRQLLLPPPPRTTRPRTGTSPLQTSPAISPRSHAALRQQAQANQAMAALGHLGMTWDTLDEQQQALLTAATHLPSAPYSPGMTETAILQKQLHAVLAPIQTAQIMAGIASQRQLAPQVIEPALLTALVQAVHYGGVTINGPDLDHEGQRHFYLEQQNGHACAQHAVNAMVGGPLVSLEHFARWESNAEAQHDVISASEEDIADTMLKQGVHPETVHGALQGLIPTHFYAHRPIVNAQGLLVLDPAQARFLDGLNTDRLLLQADRYEGDSATSHYVAFRRDAGQWVLLDSLHDAPQYGVAPSDYLLRDEGIRHFTAIWPQHALRGDSAFVEIEDMVPELPWILDEATHEDGGLQDFQVFHTDLRQQVRVDQAIAAGAVVTDEQLAQLNKTVLDDLMQKAERYSDNTALTKDYYRDVLEEVAHFLMQLPQKSSLMDLQNLLNSSYHMHVWKLVWRQLDLPVNDN